MMESDMGIVKNFFSPSEEKQLRDLVEESRSLEPGSSKNAPMVIEQMSRMQVAFDVPPAIEEKLLNLAKQFVDEDLVLSHFQYLDYYGKYGNGNSPKLPPHLDVENYYTKVSIDYQMKSNIDWAVVVEGNKFILKDNEVLVFEAADRIHWRDPIILKEDDRCEVIVFHFSNREDHRPYAENQMGQEERAVIMERHRNMPKMQQYQQQFFKDLEQLESNK